LLHNFARVHSIPRTALAARDQKQRCAPELIGGWEWLFVVLRVLVTAFDFTDVVTGCIMDQDAVRRDRRQSQTR
jgi:hypothetical protein